MTREREVETEIEGNENKSNRKQRGGSERPDRDRLVGRRETERTGNKSEGVRERESV